MTAWTDRVSRPDRQTLLTLLPILAVLTLLVFLPPDGKERADWAQFIGRFHPLTVHFPIALFLLAPILEIAGRRPNLSYLRLSVSFVLGLATIAATVAVMLGWCLARSGGYSGRVLTQHMWGGISLALVCWLCWMLRPHPEEPRFGILYAAALATGVVLVAWTGYRGGQLSQGEYHLTEYMPAPLRHLLGVSGASRAIASHASENTFYGARIEPIFTARCFTCHGPDKHKGELRLDSYVALMKGGKDGVVVKAGNVAGSDLFRRISLSPEHDDFMPKESTRPLSADQLKLIEMWIAAGASNTLPPDALKGAPTEIASGNATPEVSIPESDPAAVTKAREEIAPALAQLQKRFPNILEYESRGSADLILNASILGPAFGDDELAAVLSSLAARITVADLSRTAITDRSATNIARMKRLRVLRLMNTHITDATVQALGGMDVLESLNVFGTPVTPAVLPTIARLPRLAHVYIGQTAIPNGTSVPENLARKLVY